MTTNNPLEERWKQIEEELSQAQQARKTGNEGRARVCARRAAGQVLVAAGYSSSASLSAMQMIMTNPNTPEEIIQICSELLEKVDENHQLNSKIDLLADVYKLIDIVRTLK